MVVQNDTKITQPHSLTRNSENANLSLKGTLSILCKQGTSAGRGGGWQGLTLPHHHHHAGQDRASLFGEAKNGKKWWQLKIHTGSSSWSRGYLWRGNPRRGRPQGQIPTTLTSSGVMFRCLQPHRLGKRYLWFMPKAGANHPSKSKDSIGPTPLGRCCN